MVIIEDKGFLDGYLKDNLDLLNKAVKLNWDGLVYICGYEGDGKSTIAFQIAYYLDKTFNIDRVCFTAEQFKTACLSAKPFQAVVFDESYFTFSNRNLHNKMSVALTTMLTMIRKKQLFLFIVSPTFFDIQKYIAIHRSRAMIYVYSKGLTRGTFAFYGRKKKHNLYLKGKRDDNNMYAVKPDFIGTFGKWKPFSSKEYDEKKDLSTKDLIENITQDKEIKPEAQIKKDTIEVESKLLAYLRSHKQLKIGAIKYIATKYYNIASRSLSRRLEGL